MAKDYYDILGVAKDATPEAIKKAYRKFAMQYHPDKNKGDADAADRFKELSEAYQTLSNSDKKAQYDARHQDPFSRFANAGGSGNPMMDDFMNMFRENANMFVVGADIRVTFPMTLEQVLSGAKFNRTITRKLFNGQTQSYQPNLDIPSGVHHSDTFTKGQGGHYAQGHGTRAGGLVIQIAVKDHIHFKREDMNLIYKHQVNFIDLIEGCEIFVPLLEGGKAKINVEAGTKSDAVLSLKGKGLPIKHNSSIRGNILVHLSVYIPSEISEEDKNVLDVLKTSPSFMGN